VDQSNSPLRSRVAGGLNIVVSQPLRFIHQEPKPNQISLVVPIYLKKLCPESCK